MTDQERIAELERQRAERDQVITRQQEHIGQLEARLAVLEGQRQKESHNSSKPPSSDGLGRRTRSQRTVSGKRPGGQPGHEGQTLERVAVPDVVVRHRPEICTECQADLSGVTGGVGEERQGHELPPVHLVVTAHQGEQVTCPHCGHQALGPFPPAVPARVQYGPNLRSMAVYLYTSQFLSMERTIADLCGARISEGSLAPWVQEAATAVAPTVQRIGDLIATSAQMGGDETGIHIHGQLRWVHVASTPWLTHLGWQAKRGHVAMSASGRAFTDERGMTAGPARIHCLVTINSAKPGISPF